MKTSMKPILEETERFDRSLLLNTLLLCAFGVTMVYSASSDKSMFKSQLFFWAIGMLVIIFIQYVRYDLIYYMAPVIYLASMGCILLLKTGMGVSSNGATRWLKIGHMNFQVCEIVKIGVIFMLAFLIQKFYKYRGKVSFTIFLWLVGGIPAYGLAEISNDLGSALIVLIITFGITFVFTKTIRLHLTAVVLGISGISGIVYYLSRNMPSPEYLSQSSFRIGRIAVWLDPKRYISGQGYQTQQALYAIGHGGLTGSGLGNSVQKLGVIPEAQNDMIFSIICEELGIFGAFTLLILFVCMLYYIYHISVRAESILGSALVAGVFFHIASQTLVNICVNLNVIPNTGLTLPFISHGGTSLFCFLAEIGMVMAIEKDHVIKHCRRMIRKRMG